MVLRDAVDPEKEIPVQLTQEELEIGLQYSAGNGIPSLIEWVYGLQEIAHGRKKGEGWTVSIGSGSQDLIYKVGSLSHTIDGAVYSFASRLSQHS